MTNENLKNNLFILFLLILTGLAYFISNLKFLVFIPFLISLICLVKTKKDSKLCLSLGIYMLIYVIYLARQDLNTLFPNLWNFMNLFCPLLLALTFMRREVKLNSNLLLLFILILAIILIVNPNIAPSLITIFLIFIPFLILTITKVENYLVKLVLSLLLTLTIFSLNLPFGYVFLIITILYFIIRYPKKIISFFATNCLKSLITILVFLLFLVSLCPHLFNSWPEIFTVNLSFESANISDTYMVFENSLALNKLLGLGNLNTTVDLFSLFFNLGIVGLLFYLSFLIYILKIAKLKNVYLLTFIFALLLGFCGFNILTNIFVFTILSLIFILNKQKLKKKDILLVTNMYPSKKYPHYGIFVKNTYELLEDAGYQIDLVKMTKSSSFITKLGKYLIFYLTSFIKALTNNYDYYYVHFISHSTFPVFIPYLTSSKTKLVLNVHGNDIVADTKIDNKNIKRSRFFLKYADNVIAPSKYFQDILINEYQVNKTKITIYPAGGVDLTKFKKIPKKEALKLAGLNPKYKYLGFVSRIEKDKGYDILINAINNIKTSAKLKNIKFLIVGTGSEIEVLEKLIKKNKLSKLVERRDFLSQEELVYVYNSLEALIYPTKRKSESLGLTGLEAMACETLVIGSNLYGPGSYLNKQNSLLFNPHEEKSLEEAILNFLKLKAKEKKELIKNAYNTVEEYSQEKTKSIILDVFKK